MAFGMKDVLNGAKSVASSNLVQGVLNNYSEMSTEDMQREYGMYLMDGEEITVGFKLVRDALIFLLTDELFSRISRVQPAQRCV